MTAAVGAGRMVRDRLVDWGYAAGWTLVRALPERVAAALFARVGDLAFRRQGPGIRRLRGNLRRVVGPELPEAELDQLTRRAVRSYARYWLETFRLPVMDRDRVAARADRNTHGVEHLDRASAEGRGVILVLPHMGNYDVAGVWLIARDGPFTTVAERLRPESLFDRFMAYRQKLGMEVLPLTGGSRTPADVLVHRLRAGGTVCLVGDRDLTESGIEVTFFGEPAKMPAGPAYLAARTGASLLPVGLDAQTSAPRPPTELAAGASASTRRYRSRPAEPCGNGSPRRPSGLPTPSPRRSPTTRPTGTCCSGCG